MKRFTESPSVDNRDAAFET